MTQNANVAVPTRATLGEGVNWDAGKQCLYWVDILEKELHIYDPATGAIANRRAVIAFHHDKGHPDGMTIDEEGMLWVCFFGGGRIARCNPATGKELDQIRFPVSNVTNCVFGGPDLDTLYASTARLTLTEQELTEQPLAGSLFSVNPGVRGMPAPLFAGGLT